MASSTKKKPYGRLLIMGACSLSLYIGLMTHQEMINTYFGKGGAYAFLPIVAAFIFSYFHGAFTGDFWTVLGIEAAKKKGGK